VKGLGAGKDVKGRKLLAGIGWKKKTGCFWVVSREGRDGRSVKNRHREMTNNPVADGRWCGNRRIAISRLDSSKKRKRKAVAYRECARKLTTRKHNNEKTQGTGTRDRRVSGQCT